MSVAPLRAEPTPPSPGIDRDVRQENLRGPVGAETPAARGEMPFCARNQFSGASFTAQGSLRMGGAEALPSLPPPSRPMVRETIAGRTPFAHPLLRPIRVEHAP